MQLLVAFMFFVSLSICFIERFKEINFSGTVEIHTRGLTLDWCFGINFKISSRIVFDSEQNWKWNKVSKAMFHFLPVLTLNHFDCRRSQTKLKMKQSFLVGVSLSTCTHLEPLSMLAKAVLKLRHITSELSSSTEEGETCSECEICLKGRKKVAENVLTSPSFAVYRQVAANVRICVLVNITCDGGGGMITQKILPSGIKYSKSWTFNQRVREGETRRPPFSDRCNNVEQQEHDINPRWHTNERGFK